VLVVVLSTVLPKSSALAPQIRVAMTTSSPIGAHGVCRVQVHGFKVITTWPVYSCPRWAAVHHFPEKSLMRHLLIDSRTTTKKFEVRQLWNRKSEYHYPIKDT
jgi:hypothetical protein